MFKNCFFAFIYLSISGSAYSQENQKSQKIFINQVSKTFTQETDSEAIELLKKKPWTAKKKEVREIEASVGDVLVFHNADDFVHNVYSSFFDLKTQAPGESSEVKLDEEGTFEVQCAIHPKMKLKLKVKKK